MFIFKRAQKYKETQKPQSTSRSTAVSLRHFLVNKGMLNCQFHFKQNRSRSCEKHRFSAVYKICRANRNNYRQGKNSTRKITQKCFTSQYFGADMALFPGAVMIGLQNNKYKGNRHSNAQQNTGY